MLARETHIFPTLSEKNFGAIQTNQEALDIILILVIVTNAKEYVYFMYRMNESGRGLNIKQLVLKTINTLVWWCVPPILPHGRLNKEAQEFRVAWGYLMKSPFPTKKRSKMITAPKEYLSRNSSCLFVCFKQDDSFTNAMTELSNSITIRLFDS